MRFGSLALGIVVACAAPPGTARAFLPSPSMRGEGPLVPKDLLGKYNLRLVKSSYAFTDTLRWEMRSTLTSDEEGGATATAMTAGYDDDDDGAGAAAAAAASSSMSAADDAGAGGGGPPEDVPEYPEMLSTGIYEIVNADQHK